MNLGWIERNQQDATNLMFIIKLSQHVSGIIMPIISAHYCSPDDELNDARNMLR